MKKLIQIIVFFVILLLIPYSPVLANTINDVNAKMNENKQVTISGTISSGSGHLVSVKVVNPNNEVSYVGSTTSTKKGKFTLTYKMADAVYGTYLVTVNAYGVSESITTHFSYGSNNDLDSLVLSRGVYDTKFSSEITEYNVAVEYNATSIRVTPSVSESTSTISVNGSKVKSGKSTALIKLNDKETIIKIDVTSLSGLSKTYQITVTKNQSDIPSVTATASIDENKKVTINGSISTGSGQTITVRIKDPKGNVEYANSLVTSSGGSFQLSYLLKNKNNGKYTVIVNGSGVKESVTSYFYYLKEVSLKSLRINGITLSPVFDSSKTTYTAVTDGNIDKIYVTPVACDGADKILVNKQEVKSTDTSKAIRLRDGITTISVTVSAQTGNLSKTYSVAVEKKVKIPKTEVKANIDKEGMVSISGNVGLQTDRVVSLRVVDPNGTLVRADSLVSAADGSFQLSFLLKTPAPKGDYSVYAGTLGLATPIATTFTYKPVAELSSLTVDCVKLTPAFSSEKFNYSAAVGVNVTSIVVSPKAYDKNAIITVGGMTVISGNNSADITLKQGENVISVVVTNQGEINKYNITIYRESPVISSESTLNNLSISSGMLSPQFTKANLNYTASVINSVSSITVTPITTNSSATVKVNGILVASNSPSGNINLKIGTNNISIVVTAEDTVTKKVYTITITRAASGECDLKMVTNPAEMTVNDTTSTVSGSAINAITSVTLEATVSAEATWKLYSDQQCTKEISNKVLSLETGANIVYLKVTAADQVTSKTYVVTITRQYAGIDTTLSNLSLEVNAATVPLNQQFSALSYSYFAEVSSTSMFMTPTLNTNEEGVTITVLNEANNKSVTVDSGNSANIPLEVGENIITIIVTSMNYPNNTTTYTLKVKNKYKVIPVTGFTEDVVANGLGDDGKAQYSTTDTMDDNYVVYEDGYIDTFKGLPIGGIVNTEEGSYQLADYSVNNAILIKNANARTLTLSTPAQYENLSIFATGTDFGTPTDKPDCSVMLYFSDGSSSEYKIKLYDWCDKNIIFDITVGRINRNNNALDNDHSAGIKAYNIRLSDEDKIKTLSSISFKWLEGVAEKFVIFAVSGI